MKQKIGCKLDFFKRTEEARSMSMPKLGPCIGQLIAVLLFILRCEAANSGVGPSENKQLSHLVFI